LAKIGKGLFKKYPEHKKINNRKHKGTEVLSQEEIDMLLVPIYDNSMPSRIVAKTRAILKSGLYYIHEYFKRKTRRQKKMPNIECNKEFFLSLINGSREDKKKYIQQLEEWCSITDIEDIACEFYYKITMELHKNLDYLLGKENNCKKEKALLKDILNVRRSKLNENFTWTENYKKQLLELNKKVMDGFSMAYEEAKTQFHILKERINNNDSFIKGFNIDINLKPFILVPSEDEEYEYLLAERGKGIYYILYNMLPERLWTDSVYYEQDLDDSVSKRYEDDEVNYNIHGYFANGVFDDSFICYAMNELVRESRHIFSWYDILKINEIWAEVKVTHQHFIENIGKGVFWDDGMQSLSDNESENLRQDYLSRLTKKMTRLPAHLVIDEMNSWEKIAPFRRVKFQGDKADEVNFQKLYSMSIEENPRVLVKDAKIDLTDDELRQIKDFVSKHRETLTSIAEGNGSMLDFTRSLGNIE
jgi:hypothetical protein